MINNVLFLIFMGLVGAAIGWITNLLAIKLLFRPYQPIIIPIFAWMIQGLIPKRQRDIAKVLGNVVSSELITGNDVASSLSKDEIKHKLARKVEEHVRERVLAKLPAVIPLVIQSLVADLLSKTLQSEVANFLDDPAKVIQEEDLEDIRQEISVIVEEKVKSLDLKRLEELTYLIAQKELKHIELLGGVLGFFIGILQGTITIFFF